MLKNGTCLFFSGRPNACCNNDWLAWKNYKPAHQGVMDLLV